jgi:hypothetical protein
MTFADKVIAFYTRLKYTGSLPPGISIMNPFEGNPDVLQVARDFYNKFYSDHKARQIILGINPGRFGAGTTGITFTDTIRLNEKCGIAFHKYRTYEPSSSFVYDVIDAYGGVEHFYGRFFVSAVCPLGFTILNNKGRTVNYNYYDSPGLLRMVYPFILGSLKKQIELGIDTSVCFCLGTGKNMQFLRQINNENRFFKSIIALEHPRYIMQYKAGDKQDYIRKYLAVL